MKVETRTRRTKDEHGYEDIWTDLILILEMDAESREIEAAAAKRKKEPHGG